MAPQDYDTPEALVAGGKALGVHKLGSVAAMASQVPSWEKFKALGVFTTYPGDGSSEGPRLIDSILNRDSLVIQKAIGYLTTATLCGKSIGDTVKWNQAATATTPISKAAEDLYKEITSDQFGAAGMVALALFYGGFAMRGKGSAEGLITSGRWKGIISSMTGMKEELMKDLPLWVIDTQPQKGDAASLAVLAIFAGENWSRAISDAAMFGVLRHAGKPTLNLITRVSDIVKKYSDFFEDPTLFSITPIAAAFRALLHLLKAMNFGGDNPMSPEMLAGCRLIDPRFFADLSVPAVREGSTYLFAIGKMVNNKEEEISALMTQEWIAPMVEKGWLGCVRTYTQKFLEKKTQFKETSTGLVAADVTDWLTQGSAGAAAVKAAELWNQLQTQTKK